MSELQHRAAAAQAVVNAYLDKPLKWGEHDCGRMAAMLIREMGGKPGLSRFGRYSTPAGALKAMKARGFNDLTDVLDSMFERVPVARLLVGDIIGVPGEGMTALGIWVGNGKALAFAPDCVCRVGQLMAHDKAAAWRVPCRR